MTLERRRQYRFASADQWRTCLFSQIDHDALRTRGHIRPQPGFAATAAALPSQGARAPVALAGGDALWFDDDGKPHRLEQGHVSGQRRSAPGDLARARRIVRTTGLLWCALSDRAALAAFDEQSLARVLEIELDAAALVDIASDGRHDLFALARRADGYAVIQITSTGAQRTTIALRDLVNQPEPLQCAFVPDEGGSRFVVLTGGDAQLIWYDASAGTPLFSKRVAALRPCLRATLLAGDAHGRILLADGNDSAGVAGDPDPIVLLDGDGNVLDAFPIERGSLPLRGLALRRDAALVAGVNGLWQFTPSERVADQNDAARCVLVTPVLTAAGTSARAPWLRVEARAQLPAGTSLAISFAATDDPDTVERLSALADDGRIPPTQRILAMLREPNVWGAPMVFAGEAPGSADDAEPVLRSAPLFEARARHVWVCVTLSAARGARLPALTELAVIYPGQSLSEHLPTPYRRATEEPGSFLRALLGVLETSTQQLDVAIGGLGDRIHPNSATGPWLDYLARWLGLPWDDALTDPQKHALIKHASALIGQRGTRAGLETLLACLLPGPTRRFGIIDAASDFGYAVLGGAGCAGGRLPALLGGYPNDRVELGATAVLGRARLPCAGRVADGLPSASNMIRVSVAPTVEEHARLATFGPRLARLIDEMVPLGLRVELRWVSARALTARMTLGGSSKVVDPAKSRIPALCGGIRDFAHQLFAMDPLGQDLTLERLPDARLDANAITGHAVLPEDRAPSLREPGQALGGRLK
jgi:phage tail-like protein